jgi:hypothetical protein
LLSICLIYTFTLTQVNTNQRKCLTGFAAVFWWIQKLKGGSYEPDT